MGAPHDAITVTEFYDDEDVSAWRFVAGGAATTFAVDSFATGARLAAAIAAADENDGGRLDVDLRRDGVTVRVVTIESGVFCGLTARDVALVKRIGTAAAELGLTGDPSQLYTLQVAVAARDRPAVTAFWKALLGHIERDGPEDLMDPRAIAPAFGFAPLDEALVQRNRMHIDLYVPYDQARRRIENALAAGGRLVTDEFAPAWWVLADPEGNEACVAVLGAPSALFKEEA